MIRPQGAAARAAARPALVLLDARLQARHHGPCAAAAQALSLPRALRGEPDLSDLAALALAETFGWIHGAQASAVRGALRAALAGAADDALSCAEPDTVLVWCAALAEWCEREGLDAAVQPLQSRAVRADASAAACGRVHWRIALAWHHESFGRHVQAGAVLQEAAAVAAGSGDAALSSAVEMHLARVALAHSAGHDAARRVRRALAAAGGEADAPLAHAEAADVAARLALAQGDFHVALHQARRCHALALVAQATPAYCVTFRLNEAYALAGLGDFAAAAHLCAELARQRQPAHLAERLTLLADLFVLMQHDARGVPLGTEQLGAAMSRLRDLQWPGVLAVLPRPLARLWAQALRLRVEPRWIEASIRGRDLRPPALCWPAAWPWAVRIEVLGAFACHGAVPRSAPAPPGKAATRPQELLSHLAVEGGFDGLAIDGLAEVLWPGEDREGRNKVFEVTLARTRKWLGATDVLLLQGRRLRLNPDRVWLDRVALEIELQRVTQGRCADPARRRAHWHEALALWRGPVLADAPPVPWIMAARQRLRSRMAAALLFDAALDGHRARCLRALAADPGLEPLLMAG